MGKKKTRLFIYSLMYRCEHLCIYFCFNQLSDAVFYPKIFIVRNFQTHEKVERIVQRSTAWMLQLTFCYICFITHPFAFLVTSHHSPTHLVTLSLPRKLQTQIHCSPKPMRFHSLNYSPRFVTTGLILSLISLPLTASKSTQIRKSDSRANDHTHYYLASV